MANTQATYFDVTSPEVRQGWERLLHYEVLKRTTLFNPENGLVGDGPEFLVQRKKEQFKLGGTRTTMTLLRNLTGRPTRGTQTLRDREEGLNTSTFQFDINKVRHAVATNGEIVDQRVTWDTLEEGKILLGKWWAEILEIGGMCHLAGFPINANRTYEPLLDGSDLGITLNNAPVAPDSKHIFRPLGLANDESVGANPSAVIDLNVIDTGIAIAKTLPIPLSPVMFKGRELYVWFLHTYHVRHLRENYSQWFATMQNALKGGFADNNPLFTAALGMYSNTIFIETSYLPPGISSATGLPVANTRRSVLCGAQALAFGLGKRYADENQFKWSDEKWDYGDKFGVAASLICGLAAPRYTLSEDGTTADFGKIVCTGYAEDLISTT